MNSGIDTGYTFIDGRRVCLFGASSEERSRFFEEVLPAGIDRGIVVVDSSKEISKMDHEMMEEYKGRNMPCLVLSEDPASYKLPLAWKRWQIDYSASSSLLKPHLSSILLSTINKHW